MHKAIGANIFAGGFTAGVREHFEVLAHFEHGPYGSDTMALNLPQIKLHPNPAEWPRTPRYPGQRERTRFVYCNPPCAPFSGASAGRATSWDQDPRLQCFLDCFGLLETIEPDVLVIESVVNSWTNAGTFCRDLAKRAEAWGYSATVVLHNAVHLGVPQVRKRVFYVFHKVEFEPISPRFGEAMTVRQAWKGLKVPATTRKRFAASVVPRGQALAMLRHTPAGGRLAKTFNDLNPDAGPDADGKVRGRPSFLECRAPLDEPMNVLMGGNKLFHPVEDRLLYPEELMRLGSFPDDWRWSDRIDLGTIGKHISQGVAPRVGSWIGASALAAIERGKRVNQPRLAVCDLRDGPGRMNVIDYAQQLDEEVPMAAKKTTVHAAPGGPPDREADEKSGAYIRRLLKMTYPSESILERVHAQFPGSKATKSDISYNKGILKKEGWQFGGAETYAPSGSLAYMPKAKSEPEPAVKKTPKYAVLETPPWETPERKSAPKQAPPSTSAAVKEYPFAAVRSKIAGLHRGDQKKLSFALQEVLSFAVDLAEKLSGG